MIDKTFAFHLPGDEAKGRIKRIREGYSTLKALIEAESPTHNRERAKGLTELEDSAMWVIKSVVSNDPNSVAEIEP